MNLGYFPKPDSGIEARAAWAMPSTGFGENAGARWDEARTPDHGSIYDRRALPFYDEVIAKLKEHNYGDFPNPFYMVAPDFEHALIGGEGNPAMVDAVRHAAPRDYQPGGPFNPFALRDAWRKALDDIAIEARKLHPDVPDTTTFDKSVAEESAATRTRAADIASRATFMGKVGGMIGGTAGTMSRDEEIAMTALTLPLGGGAATLARTLVGRLLAVAATDAAIGAAQTGASEFAEAKFQQEHFGYSKTGREIVMDMAYAAAGSALLGAGLQGIGEGAGYLLSRWRTRPAGAETGGASLPPRGLTPVEAATPTQAGTEPIVVGLHSAAEHAQALYPILPKIGRDAATILERERQVAANGPAADLFTHSENVARAAEAVTNGERTIPIDLPGRNYFESETTPDGFQLETTLEVVEFDELRPGSRLSQQVKQDIDTGIATLKAMPDEEIIRFRIEGTLTPEGKAKRGGKTVESHLGFGVHDGFDRYIGTKPDKYINGELVRWNSPERLRGGSGAGQEPDTTHSFYRALFELKPKSTSGKYLGKKQMARYERELGMRTFSLEWGITQVQHDEIIKIKQRIRRLQEAAGLWAKPKRIRNKAKRKPKSL
jgi:hypothetical protein